MASFTDLPPQFTPYTPQLPVEAMAQVGMAKQAKYEQGLQKIQAQIDQVAGMDILKDVDKNYLQSKLNELGGNLTMFAAADFSNFQLVNSVAGMTKQVARDTNIQNAVSSTAHYRSEVKRIEEAKKKGKSDKNNEEYFYNDASKWINDGQVGSKFSDSFSEYTDIMKAVRENVTAAGLDASYIEQVFETDGKGNILRDKDNHPIPARTMAAESLDTNAAKVKAIVQNVMAQGDVQNQVKIDAWANTRNVSVQSVYDTFENDYIRRDVDDNEDVLALQAFIDANNLSPDEKKALVAQQDAIKQRQEANRKSLEALRKKAIENPDEFKQEYYKDGYINNLINGFTTVKRKKEVKDSPLTKVLQWEERMNFDRSNENFNRMMQRDASKRGWTTIALSEDQNRREWLKFEAEYEVDPATGQYVKKDTGDGKKKGKGVTTLTPSEIKAENAGTPIDAENSYRSGTDQMKAEAQQKGFDLIYTYLNKLNGGKKKDGTPFTKNDALNSINSWANANNETPYQFIMRFALGIQSKAQKEEIDLSVQDKEALNNLSRLNNNIIGRTAVTENLYRQVQQETGMDLKNYKNFAFKPILFISPGSGEKFTITPQDQYDYVTALGSGFVTSTPEENAAMERIKQKFKTNNWRDLGVALRLSGQDMGVYDTLAKSPNFKRAQTALAEKFQKINIVGDTFSATLSGTDEEKKAAKGKLAPLFNVSRLSESEQQSLLKALTSSESVITYDAKRPTREGEEWSGRIILTDKDGKQHAVDVNQTNLEMITGREFNPYREDVLAARARVSQYRSTNLGAYVTDPNAYQSAAIQSYQFSSLQNTDYTAFADVLPMDGGNLGFAIYAKDKSMKGFERIEMVPVKTIINGRPVYFTDYNEIAEQIPKITPGMIKDALNKKKQKK